jgi:phage gp36-like protein
MSYATKSDIEAKYGGQITEMIADHGFDLVELAETAMNDAIAADQSQTIIDDLETAYLAQQATYQTDADNTIDTNLEDASGFIDGYIKTRYPRNWIGTPPLLRSLNVDIAVYYMSLSADWRTEEMKVRYDAAVKTLENIRDNLVDLLGEMEPAEDEETVIVSGGIGVGSWVRS